ncbi:DUF1189 domain-containing protein [Bacillus alveayuensis]|jgi:hypothetical protein|uniref:DUF1189 domain-containing protein n=1 Tax=Aeribacillus alveayuensis TaxID=279215 RepID=UPI0005D0F02C|nr:DUF1189 domain-containing protein [Bacillus alveayuensis]
MNMFLQLIQSLYSPKIIAMTRFQKIGKTILYAFLLSFLAFLPNAIYFSHGIISGFKGLDETMEAELPDFSIKNGKLISEVDQPIEVKKGDYILVLDNQGILTKKDLEKRRNAIGLLTDQFVFVTNGQAQTFEYTMFENTLMKKDLIQIIQQLKKLMPIILTVFLFLLYLSSSFVKFIEISFLALVAILLKNRFGKKLNFKHLWTISAYSITLATVFLMIMDVFKSKVPFEFYINWCVHLIILYLTLKEIPSPKKQG